MRAPTFPLTTLLSFFPVYRFAPPFPTVRTSLLLSDDVYRRCNLACDRLFTLVVKFLHTPFWRPCALAPGDICTPLPPPYATPLPSLPFQKQTLYPIGHLGGNNFFCFTILPPSKQVHHRRIGKCVVVVDTLTFENAIRVLLLE